MLTNQPCILGRSLLHLGTKLPSSNWPAEIFTKLFTSADATHTHGVTESQSVRRSYGNLHGFILPFIHLLSPASSLTFCSSGPFTKVRNPNPRNRTKILCESTQPAIHTDTHTLALIFCYMHFTFNRIKGPEWGIFFFFYKYFSAVGACLCVCVYECVVGWIPIRSSRCAA